MNGPETGSTTQELKAVWIDSPAAVANVVIDSPITLQVSNRTGAVNYQFRSTSTAASMTFNGNISMAYAPGASTATGVKAYTFDTTAGNSITLNGNLGAGVSGTTSAVQFGNKGGQAGANYYVNGDNSALGITGNSIIAGNVYVGSANALGSASVIVRLNNTTTSPSVLTNDAVTLVASLKTNNVNATGMTVGGATAQNSGFSGAMDLANSGMIATAVAGGRVVFSGVVSGNNITAGQASSVEKTGTGTVVFTGSNGYRGGTTVTAGTLLINNASGNGTGDGPVTVSANGTLGGTGTISLITGNGRIQNPNLSVFGTLAPGDTSSIGSLRIDVGTTTGNVTMQTGANFAFDLNGTLNTSDQIRITGTAAAGDFALNNNVFNFTLAGSLVNGQTYTLIDGTANNQFTGLTLSGNQITSGLGFSGLSGGFQANSFLTLVSGDVIFNAVPEPSTSLLIVIGLTAFVIMSRRGLAARV